MGLNAVDAVRPLLMDGTQDQLAAALRGVHRYPNARSRYIVHSRNFLRDHCNLALREKLDGFRDHYERRDWLVMEKGIKGLGYKEASHFLRNVGFKGYAILDKHILRSLAELKIIHEPKPPNTRKAYLTIEEKLRHLTRELRIDFDELDRLRKRNPDVKIRAGVELDNDPKTSAAGRKWVEQNWERLDFVLGSVHYLSQPDQMFDSVPDGARQFSGRNIDEIYSDYFRRIREIAASGLVDCLAHLDLVKVHGHRPCTPIAELVDETLDLIRSRNLAIELSTAGWRKPVTELYPSDGILTVAIKKGIPFTVASDAHSWAQLAENYDRLSEKMNAFEIGEICVYERHERIVKEVKPVNF